MFRIAALQFFSVVCNTVGICAVPKHTRTDCCAVYCWFDLPIVVCVMCVNWEHKNLRVMHFGNMNHFFEQLTGV